MRNQKVRTLVTMGMLCGISILLVYLIHFPIFPSAAFLEYDMADVPILIGTFLFGPLGGLAMTAIVSVLQWLVVSPQSGWVGAAMHFFATGAFVLVAGMIYRHHKTKKAAVVALALGVLTMVLAMIPLNLIFTVHFMGQPQQVVVDMLLPIIIPFNAIKAGVNAILTFILYKSVARIFRGYVNDHVNA